MPFSDYLVKLAPTSLQRTRWSKYLGGVGQAFDDLYVAAAKWAVKARFPLDTTPADALNAIGADRLLPRGPSESDDAYRARLRGAWDAWQYAGTPLGLLRALHYAGFNPAIAVAKGRWYTLDGSLNLVDTRRPDGSGFTLDGSGGAFWSKFNVVFKQPLPASWVSGGVPSVGSDDAKLIMGLIKLWSPAWSTCSRVVIVTAGAIWGDPTLRWGDSGLTWGGSTVVWSF